MEGARENLEMWVTRPAAGQYSIAKPAKDENKARITQ